MKKIILTLGILVLAISASFGQQNEYYTNLGAGNGFKLANSDHYKLSLGYDGDATGSSFYYGPVQSWAIKMSNFPGGTQKRGWVWGVSTPGVAPIAALGISGDMQIKGHFLAKGGTGTIIRGVSGHSFNASFASIGVEGRAFRGKYSYGVHGSASDGTAGNYGIYGTAAVVNNSYAGYFAGNVYTNAMYQGSDRKLKENIKPLKNTDKLMLLQPKEYTYRTDEFESMNLEEGTQMGFIAQDIEAIFPELIKETIQPPTLGENGEIIQEAITFKAVNYVAIIPLLTATVQEQNILIEEQNIVIEEQEESISDLMKRVSQLENNTSTSIESDEIKTEVELFQNAPNPFNEKTMIKYNLPVSTNQASIMIFDMNGTHKLTIEANVLEGEISVDAKDLSPGIYIYSLIADRIEVASKRMIITK